MSKAAGSHTHSSASHAIQGVLSDDFSGLSPTTPDPKRPRVEGEVADQLVKLTSTMEALVQQQMSSSSQAATLQTAIGTMVSGMQQMMQAIAENEQRNRKNSSSHMELCPPQPGPAHSSEENFQGPKRKLAPEVEDYVKKHTLRLKDKTVA